MPLYVTLLGMTNFELLFSTFSISTSLIPRSIYTSGKGSSVVDLTAYVTKDPETRELILESGDLVLSDKGIC